MLWNWRLSELFLPQQTCHFFHAIRMRCQQLLSLICDMRLRVFPFFQNTFALIAANLIYVIISLIWISLAHFANFTQLSPTQGGRSMPQHYVSLYNVAQMIRQQFVIRSVKSELFMHFLMKKTFEACPSISLDCIVLLHLLSIDGCTTLHFQPPHFETLLIIFPYLIRIFMNQLSACEFSYGSLSRSEVMTK